MEIKFVGPLGKVTGSCTWMRDITRGWNFLVDCGMQQGEYTAQTWNSCENWPFNPAEIQFMVLTHAHADHSGLIPMLYKRGFTGKVYCTEETSELAKILLRDSARKPGAQFNENDLERIQWHTPSGGSCNGGYHPVTTDLFVRFFRSGHIIGAVSVTVVWGAPNSDRQKSIVFSGDIGPGSEENETSSFLRYPLLPKPADYAVVESTYGGKIRSPEEKDPKERRKRLKKLLDDIVHTRGTLAIPAFAVGRTQEILFDMHRLVAANPGVYDEVEFYLDASMAQQVNEVTAQALSRTGVAGNNGKVRPLWLAKRIFRDFELDKDRPEHLAQALKLCQMALSDSTAVAGGAKVFTDGNEIARLWKPLFRYVRDRETLFESKIHAPRVIVMGSGTGDTGASAFWLPRLLPNDRNIVSLSGYCAPSTIGGQLQAIANIPPDQIKLLTGQLVWSDEVTLALCDVKASTCAIGGYSAHGDQEDLLSWIFHEFKGKEQIMAETLFLQHGDDPNRESFRSVIESRASVSGFELNIIKPTESDDWFDLERDGELVRADIRREEKMKEFLLLQKELEGLGVIMSS